MVSVKSRLSQSDAETVTEVSVRGGTALLIGITPPGAQAILDTSLFIGSRSFTRTSGGYCRPDRDFPLFVRWYREGKLKLDECDPAIRLGSDQ